MPSLSAGKISGISPGRASRVQIARSTVSGAITGVMPSRPSSSLSRPVGLTAAMRTGRSGSSVSPQAVVSASG